MNDEIFGISAKLGNAKERMGDVNAASVACMGEISVSVAGTIKFRESTIVLAFLRKKSDKVHPLF